MKNKDTNKKVTPKKPVTVKGGLAVIANIFEVIGVYLFHFRKVLLCLPVAGVSIYLARLNWTNLPDKVGISLMANGQFADMVSKEVAVYGPMAVTATCLLLMICSRRALYPWLISVFTLVLPLLILITNIFPS